jgi:hypothetical protein
MLRAILCRQTRPRPALPTFGLVTHFYSLVSTCSFKVNVNNPTSARMTSIVQ